jgi:hypothetical protein
VIGGLAMGKEKARHTSHKAPPESSNDGYRAG